MKKKYIAILAAIFGFAAQSVQAEPRQGTFAWDANPVEDAVTGYNLYRLFIGTTPAENTYLKINSSALINATEYTTTIDSGWIVVVRAVNAEGESGDSNAVTVQSPPTAPKNFRKIAFNRDLKFTIWEQTAKIS